MRLSSLVRLLVLVVLGARAVAEPLDGESLYRHVEHYARLGEHRTGTPPDLATSRWLAQSLESAGFRIEQQEFELEQFFPTGQSLQFGEETVAVFPHWFPRGTAAPLEAPLMALDATELRGAIAYLAPDKAGTWYQLRPAVLAEQAAAKGARALVIAAPHPSQDIYVTNAAPPHLQQSLAIPTVVVAARDHTVLARALASGAAVQLRSEGETRASGAVNVVARYPAEPVPDAPWVVVSTPTSGWFRAAGERGGGIALWLDLAHYIAARDTGLNWLFVANSGHELDFMGARRSLPTMPPPEAVALWLHLGASIGARRWGEQGGELLPLDEVHEHNVLYASDALLSVVSEVFDRVPSLQILGAKGLGQHQSELATIIATGYRAFGLVGSHHFFHTPEDTPAVTSAQLLAPYGEALRRLVDHMSRRENPAGEAT